MPRGAGDKWRESFNAALVRRSAAQLRCRLVSIKHDILPSTLLGLSPISPNRTQPKALLPWCIMQANFSDAANYDGKGHSILPALSYDPFQGEQLLRRKTDTQNAQLAYNLCV